jgi:hypothetical protein
VDLVDAEDHKVESLEVLQDAEWGAQHKSGKEFFEEIVRAVEDEIPGQNHDEDLISVGQDCKRGLGGEDTGQDAARECVEDAKDEAGERILTSKVEGIALVAVQHGSQAQRLQDAVGGPQHRKDWETEESLLNDIEVFLPSCHLKFKVHSAFDTHKLLVSCFAISTKFEVNKTCRVTLTLIGRRGSRCCCNTVDARPEDSACAPAFWSNEDETISDWTKRWQRLAEETVGAPLK